jgi:hypothetical protein
LNNHVSVYEFEKDATGYLQNTRKRQCGKGMNFFAWKEENIDIADCTGYADTSVCAARFCRGRRLCLINDNPPNELNSSTMPVNVNGTIYAPYWCSAIPKNWEPLPHISIQAKSYWFHGNAMAEV